MPRVVRLSVSDLQLLDRVAPAHVRVLECAHGLAVVSEEDDVVVDLAGAHVLLVQGELPPEDGEGTRTQLHRSILICFGAVFVLPEYDGLANLNRALYEIAVCYAQPDLFGLPQSGEESELIKIADRFAPLLMKASNQLLRFLNAERVDLGAILFRQSERFQPLRRACLAGKILVTKLECTAQGADAVVVGLLRLPSLGGGDLDEL